MKTENMLREVYDVEQRSLAIVKPVIWYNMPLNQQTTTTPMLFPCLLWFLLSDPISSHSPKIRRIVKKSVYGFRSSFSTYYNSP